jgi:acetolactate synthase-1/3 small subunit
MIPKTNRTFIVYVEDLPGVLNRVTSLLRRRNYNIMSMAAGCTEQEGVSRLTIVVEADEDAAARIEANLYKIINVLFVEDTRDAPMMLHELALVKVRADAGARREVMHSCRLLGARVVDVGPGAVLAEITGTRDEVAGVIDVLRPFGILEAVRTGVVGMVRCAQGSDADRSALNSPLPAGSASALTLTKDVKAA